MAADQSTFIWSGAATRIDKVLRSQYGNADRGELQRLLGQGKIQVSGKVVRLSSWKVEPSQVVTVFGSPGNLSRSADNGTETSWNPAWLVASTPDYIVVNKPSGMRSEPAYKGDRRPNMLSMLRDSIDDSLRLAHRLDRDTSGLLIATPPGPARAEMDHAFKQHAIAKRYVAVVAVGPSRPGYAFSERGTIKSYIGPDPARRDAMVEVAKGGQLAVTDFVVVESTTSTIRLHLWPRTGRTHQLRVQMAAIGHPILGDSIYGNASSFFRLALHAEEIVVPQTASLAGESRYLARCEF